MPCPYCKQPTPEHDACWKENRFRRQWSFLFTNPEELAHLVKGDWQAKTVWINGRKLTGAIYHQFMQIDPLWDWEDSQANYTDELAAWDREFRWGDESPGTFFLSIALQRWLTMRMSLMQQYFYPILVDLPQADFTLAFRSDDIFRQWVELEGRFRQEFTECLTDSGFEGMEE
jgi:hypothetical protein